MSLPGTAGALPQHSDVLGAQPDTPEQTKELIAEIRRRGNAAFKGKSFLEAEILYGKAIELEPEGDPAIYGNRAAARIGMKKFKEALEDADSAVKIGWPKGHFRRGQALAGMNRFREAQKAYEECAALDASNVEAKREAEKMRSKAEEDENKMEVEDTSPAPKPKETTKAKASEPKKAAKTTSKSSEKATTDKDDDEGSLMKGYKTKEDGSKTTYFHREIDPAQKAKLAQENRPQALQSVPVPAASQDKKKGSAWNAAGTFEEKDQSKWAQDKIKELLGDTSTVFEAPDGESGVVEVTGVSDIDGVASVSMIRGKRKYPFDMTFNVNWTASIPEGEIKGQLFYSQFNSEDDEFEAEVRCENRSKAGKSEASLMQHLKKEFREEVDSQLREFVEAFRQL